MNIKVIYHKDCLDGFGAAVAVAIGFSLAGQDMDKVDFLPLQYGTKTDENLIPDSVLEGCKTIYFIDICPPRRELLDLAERAEKHGVTVVVLDHHKTAIDTFGELGENYITIPEHSNLKLMLDKTRSGARIAYDVFVRDTSFSKKAFRFFELISNRDLWKDDKDAKSLSGALSVEPKEITRWIELLTEFMSDEEELLARGDAIIDREEALVKEIAPKIILVKIGGHTVPLAFAPKTLASEVGNYIAAERPEYPFAAVAEMGTDVVSISLRSKHFDTESVALSYGGGGHKLASGFRMSRLDFLELLK